MKTIILFFFSFACYICAFCQTSDLKFKNFSVDNGLSNNSVNSILQDSRSFIWIATTDGLNRFDGYEYKVYKPNFNDSNSLRSNNIRTIFEDSEKNIWFGTGGGGISCYIYSQDRFVSFGSLSGNGLNTDVINSIVEDNNKNLWIGTHEGLYMYNRNTSRFVKIDPQNKLKESYVMRLAYNNGVLWIGTLELGLFSYNIKNAELKQIKDKSIGMISSMCLLSDADILIGTRDNGLIKYNNKNGVLSEVNLNYEFFKSHNIINIYEDFQKNIWVCGENIGLFKMNKTGKILHQYQYNDNDKYSISSNSVSCFFEDQDGNYWLGTSGTGYNLACKNEKAFKHVSHVKNISHTLSSNNVTCFYQTPEGKILIGTDGGGINTFNTVNYAVENQSTTETLRLYSTNYVLQIAKDKESNYWLASWDKGLVNIKKNGLIRKFDFALYNNVPQLNTLIDLMVDSQNNIWFSAFGEGLFVYKPKQDSFEDKSRLLPQKTKFIRIIKEDLNRNIWIGTYGKGLIKLYGDTCKYFDNFTLTQKSYSRNLDIYCIYEDSKNQIWVGSNNGLYVFKNITDTFSHYSQKEGLLNSSVMSILEDNHNNLWLSTTAGIAVFNPNLKTFKNYDVYDGLQSNQFNAKASLKTSNGFMLFGGINGFTYFHPDSIKDNTVVPKVYIDNIKINNINLSAINAGEYVMQNTIFIKELTLNSQHKSITFSFVALNFISSRKNQYAYMLEGFEKKWNMVGTSRSATYTNLSPGEYLFKVKACNNDGYWNNAGTSIRLTVLPPLYRSNWAMVIYVVLLAFILIISRRITIKRERAKNSLEFERYQTRKTHELDMAKIKFFTNISHEFRTPLTLILSPLEKFLNTETDNKRKNNFLLMHRNVRRLLFLINQLMDFRKMEAGELKLKLTQGDVVQYISNISLSFNYLAEQNSVAFKFESNIDSFISWFDKDKIEKIIYNLLSNAFKFTHKNGTISISINISEQYERIDNKLFTTFEIRVNDSGIGISENQIDKIFDMFYQVEDSNSQINQGSGIGLSFTKELVALHKGTIRVESIVNVGSCFIVDIPLLVKHSDSDSEIETSSVLETFVFHDIEKKQSADVESKEVNKKKFHILVVEDNTDLRLFIKENLEPDYNVSLAYNGEEGLVTAINTIPDVIISDIIMPKMDGLTLCKRIKQNVLTCHIPVILLTSKNTEDEIIEGFSEGADEYIPKPFNFQLLEIRIKNLIESRIKLRERFTKKISVEPKDIAITSVDEKFVQRALEIVENNISNTEFSVEEFSREMGMSRMSLYRKIYSLTGKTPVEFIRIMRLKRSAQYLKESQLTVSEICYKVGFKDVDYFRKVFKKEFNVLPTEYISNNKE